MQLLQHPMLPLLLLLAGKSWTHECIRPILTVCCKKSGNSQAELEKEGDLSAAQNQVKLHTCPSGAGFRAWRTTAPSTAVPCV
jgi:hypothetical protein